MSAQPELAPRLVSFHEAARRLRLSRGQLADAVLWHGIPTERAGDLFLNSDDMERLADHFGTDQEATRRTSALPPGLNRVVWLLADWGGCARQGEIAQALGISLAQVSMHLKELRARKYVHTSGGRSALHELTPVGRDHVSKERRPV